LTVTVDVYSITNPAFVGVVIYKFVDGYLKESANSDGPEFSLLFLPAPIAISQRIAATFEGTNVRTGLTRWYLRNEVAQLSLPRLVRETTEVSRNALLFAFGSGSLVLEESGRVTCDPSAFAKKPKERVGIPIFEKTLTVSQRFGQWCGANQSASAIYSLLGVRP